MFIFRLIYGYVVISTASSDYYNDNFFESIDNLRKNYATEKIISKGEVTNTDSPIASNQKYEKTASLRSNSSTFEKDEKTIKNKSKTFNAVIQYEQNLGQNGNRQIHLLIGVSPNLFDSLYSVLKTIGKLKGTEITKVDKTNEYRQLNAKKASIEKTLHSLNELKSKGGEITDFIALNEKILETEEKAQELGVELGNFNSENDFCTIRLSMYESATEKQIGLLQRIKVALEWTIKYYFMLAFSAVCISIGIYIILFIIDKLKIIPKTNSKSNE